MFKKTMIAAGVAALFTSAAYAVDMPEEPALPDLPEAALEIVDQSFTSDETILTKSVNYKITADYADVKTPGFFALSGKDANAVYSGVLTVTNEGKKAKVTGLYASGSTLTNAGAVAVTSQKSWETAR